MKKLDTKKVLVKIDYYINKISDSIHKDEEFSTEHEEILIFCSMIFTKKSEYKEMNRKYPLSMVIIFDPSFGGEDKGKIEMPNKEIKKKIREEFGSTILSILQKAKKYYTLKSELEVSS